MTHKFAVKKNLTPPLFKFAEDVTLYLLILSPIYIGKPMKAKEGEKKREPAHLADVVNMETGEAGQIIVSAVVASVFAESYPNDGHVGKGFAITKRGKVPGKEYTKYDVQEVEVPAAEEPKAVPVEKSAKSK